MQSSKTRSAVRPRSAPPKAHLPIPTPASRASSIPSIYELGRLVQILIEAGNHLDVIGEDEKKLEAALGLATDREIAIRELLVTFPAATLQDATAQLCAAFSIVSRILASEMSERELRSEVATLRRVILSVAPVVALAGSTELADVGGAEIDLLRTREFYALAQATGGRTEP